ncbi:MAG TPA: helix-turn-helix transcriptional regulator [Rhizomicrobium sp.]|jgi:DNA-binding CsgD family transcriptional regulator|nr:helix-turn-helix transcriptional regulator [Rhizomicrobium sp.]
MQGALSDNLLDAIYNPAMRAGEWRPALRSLRDLLSSAEIAFTVVHSGSSQPELWETTGAVLSSGQCDNYQSDYMRLDPKLPILAERGRGFLFNDIEHFDDRFVAHDPFYQGYSLPLALRHTLDLFVDSFDGRDVYLAAMRSPAQGPFSVGTADQLKRASAHFLRALKARDHLSRIEATARHATAALDRFEFGVAVVDADSRLLFANALARATFREDAPFRLVGANLSARVCQKPVADGVRNAVRGHPATFRLRDREDWLVSTIPLPAESPAAPSALDSAMVVFRRAGRQRLPAADEIMALYGLTPAEAEVALAIAEGKSTRVLAAERHVKLSTIRWQLLAVLQKLGVRRQADVVRVMTAIRPGC